MLLELFKELDAKRRDRFQVEARTDARRFLAQKERDEEAQELLLAARHSIREAVRILYMRSAFPVASLSYPVYPAMPRACRGHATGTGRA
jgi:hypothetical protein